MPAEQVCQGLDEAVQTMKVHEVADITVQPQYGYGSQQQGFTTFWPQTCRKLWG